MMKIVWQMTMVFLAACTTKPIKPTILHLAPLKSASELLFPYGHYKHHVDLHFFHGEDGGDKRFSFEGVVETSKDRIHMVMLSPFNTTLMKINEDRTSGEVEVETFDPRLRRYEDKFSEYYSELRKIFVMGRAEKIADVTPSEFKKGVPHHLEIKKRVYELNIDVEPLDEIGN